VTAAAVGAAVAVAAATAVALFHDRRVQMFASSLQIRYYARQSCRSLPGVNVIKLFSSPDKLERFFMALRNIFVKARSPPWGRVVHLGGLTRKY